jgi:ABC-type Fe3+ transport system permease subunit
MRCPTPQAGRGLVVFWRYVGFNLVLYLAALQTIPHDLYQAAKLDGAGPWQQFWRITLPGLQPMILFGVTLSVIGGLQLFEEPFILTNGKGGADQQAMTVGIYLYRLAFDFSDFGGASALAWIMFGVIAALTWLTNRGVRRRQVNPAEADPEAAGHHRRRHRRADRWRRSISCSCSRRSRAPTSSTCRRRCSSAASC